MSEVGHVNKELGDDTSKLLYEAAKQSYDNRPGAITELHPSFSGLRAIPPDYKPDDCFELLGSDGVGTKVEIAEREEDHTTIAYDLFAMVCDDAVIRGAEPIAINTVLDVNKLLKNDALTERAVRELAAGYVAAASLARVIILNGETAELGDRVNGYGLFNYNWGATLLSYIHKDRILAGDKIKTGHALVGIKEEGFRSNGLTDVRRILTQEFGSEWHREIEKSLGSTSLGQLVKRPSIIYTPLMTELTGGCDIEKEPTANISGAAHITGGGIPGKLGRMLEPSGLGAILDTPQTPPTIMSFVQEIGESTDEKAYEDWNMGSGMIIASPEPETVIEVAEKKGYRADIVGNVTKKPGIKVTSKGTQKPGETLIFD